MTFGTRAALRQCVVLVRSTLSTSLRPLGGEKLRCLEFRHLHGMVVARSADDFGSFCVADRNRIEREIRLIRHQQVGARNVPFTFQTSIP